MKGREIDMENEEQKIVRPNVGGQRPIRPMPGQRPVRPMPGNSQRSSVVNKNSLVEKEEDAILDKLTSSFPSKTPSNIENKPIQNMKVEQEVESEKKVEKRNINTVTIEALPIPEGTDNKDPNKKNYVMYMIVDKQIDGMLDYFRSYGVQVSRIFNNVGMARDTMLMQIDPSLLVVIDTGSGKFVNMSVRKELIDLLGMSDDENKAIIFYSDTNLKYDIEYAKEVNGKDIKWMKYKSTVGVLAELLQLMKVDNLKYLRDSEYGRTIDIHEDLAFKGIVDPEYIKQNPSILQINTSDIVAKRNDASAEEIEKFRVPFH